MTRALFFYYPRSIKITEPQPSQKNIKPSRVFPYYKDTSKATDEAQRSKPNTRNSKLETRNSTRAKRLTKRSVVNSRPDTSEATDGAKRSKPETRHPTSPVPVQKMNRLEALKISLKINSKNLRNPL